MTRDDSLPPEQLLAETDWLRGLALSLVRDPDRADDLYQDTVLVALRRGDSRRGRLRPWLAGIARKLLVGQARTRAREQRRLQRVARSGEAPATADVVAEFTTQRRVVETVGDLVEPFRTAIVLRFYEGLPPRDIAARLDVPVETVRTRLKAAWSCFAAASTRSSADGRRGAPPSRPSPPRYPAAFHRGCRSP